MAQNQLENLLLELVKQSKESEWVEFKHNNNSPEEIGQRLSALSNGACIHNQEYGYLVYGVEDGSHKIIGTKFRPKTAKKRKRGN